MFLLTNTTNLQYSRPLVSDSMRYYSYIKNYQRDDGKAFMENVYNAGKDEKVGEKEEKAAN